MPYNDGETPNNDIIDNWLKICNKAICNNENILIHCYSGLGRAPLLLALKFIEDGINFIDTIELIREKRKGALNKIQLDFIRNYSYNKKKCKCDCNIQ